MPELPGVVPELHDESVTLRAHREADLPGIVATCTDPRTRRWLPLPEPYDEADARNFLARVRTRWADGTGWAWAIEAGGRYAGTVQLRPRSPASAELSFHPHPDARGADLVPAAVRLVLRHAFADLHLSTVTWRAGRGDWAARRVAWSCGFTVDGTWPDQGVAGDGSAQDEWIAHASAAESTRGPLRPWWEPAVLESADLRLRPWRESDAAHLRAPDGAARILVEDMQPTAETFERWLLSRRERMADGEGVFWCVADRADDRPLGHVQVVRLDVDFIHGTGELGYWLYPEARGRGVMSGAIELLRAHAFSDRADPAGSTGLGLHRLRAGSDIVNRASARVLRRAGFRHWGTEKSVLARSDRPAGDALNWELLAADDVDSQRVSPVVVPTIELDDIRLRPWRESDRAAVPPEPDELIRRYLPQGAQMSPAWYDGWLARQRQFADEGTTLPWCVADSASDTALGALTIFRIGERTSTSAEVGYWLLPAGRGRGVLQRAMEALVEHAFAPTAAGGLGLARLYAETDLDNYASRSLLRTAGFVEWGQDRAAYTAPDGSFTDGAYFELLATDDREAQRAAPPPALDFPDVRLRPLRPDDATAIAGTWAEPDVRQWLAMPPHDLASWARTYVAAKARVDNGAHGSWWVICAPGSEDFAGVVGLQDFDGLSAEIGYWLPGRARGRGLATAAVRAVTSYAFMPVARGGLGLGRVRAAVAQENQASLAVVRRLGFEEYGRARRADRLADGTVVDLVLLDRLADPAAP